jgi:hypothetical protein
MTSPNLSITLNQRHWSCVLAPSLFLSDYGLLLVQALGETLELWVARELWHILDNPSFYLQQPESILPHRVLEASGGAPQQQVIQVLKNWESVRAETHPANLNLFWIGDKPGESFFPRGTDPQLMDRWEALAGSLDSQLGQQSITSHVMASAVRDTAALAVALSSAFILTHQPTPESTNSPPEICLILEQWGIPCQQIDPPDLIATIERENLLQLIISTGFSKFLWAGLQLVVLHLVVPSTFNAYCKAQPPQMIHSFNQESDPTALPIGSSCVSPSVDRVWEGAQGFWYRL